MPTDFNFAKPKQASEMQAITTVAIIASLFIALAIMVSQPSASADTDRGDGCTSDNFRSYPNSQSRGLATMASASSSGLSNLSAAPYFEAHASIH